MTNCWPGWSWIPTRWPTGSDRDLPKQLRELMKNSMLDLLSEQAALTNPRTGQLWQNICTQCDLGISTLTTLASAKLPGGEEHAQAARRASSASPSSRSKTSTR